MRKENDARLAIRVPKERADYIKYQAQAEGVSQKDYTLRALDFYDEFRHLAKEGYVDHLEQMSAIRHRSEKIRLWCNRLGITMSDFYLDALNFYLDTLILTDGQPDTMSMVTLNTLLRTISSQLDSVETKIDTQTNIAINGFSSFARISAGASYLIDELDDGVLPETKVNMR